MFTPLPSLRSLAVPLDQIVAVIESINAPNVAIPDLGTGPAKGYLVGCVTPTGNYTIFCYLLMTETMTPVVYVSSPAEVRYEMYSALEREAIQFLESMGFMLDNMNFRARPAHEQAQLAAGLPFLHEPPAARPPSASFRPPSSSFGMGGTGAGAVRASPSAELVALARLLSSY